MSFWFNLIEVEFGLQASADADVPWLIHCIFYALWDASSSECSSHTLQLDISAGVAHSWLDKKEVGYLQIWLSPRCVWEEIDSARVCACARHQVGPYDCRWLQRLRGGRSCVPPSPGGSTRTSLVHHHYSPRCPKGWGLTRSRRRPCWWLLWLGHSLSVCTRRWHWTCPSRRRTPSPKWSCSGPPPAPDSCCSHSSPGW